jgi:hypothetical protein
MKEVTAIVAADQAVIKIDAFGQQHELVIEDETERACVMLTPGIAREIIAKLTGWLEASAAEPSDEELAAAFRDVYAHIGVKP